MKIKYKFYFKVVFFKLNNILCLYYKKIKLIICYNICFLYEKLKML